MTVPKKVRKRTVTVDNQNDKIRLRFSYLSNRYRISTGLDYNEKNLILVEAVKKRIIQDIVGNNLDTTLGLYKKMMRGETTPVSSEHTVNKPAGADIYTTYMRWIDYKVKRREISDDPVPSNYHYAGQVLRTWGNTDLAEVQQKLMEMEYSPSAYNDRLTCLRNFFEWCVVKGIYDTNPLKDIPRKKGNRLISANRRPFTEEELHRIIKAYETDQFCPKRSRYKHSHYAPFIKFMVFTGVRNAEAVGLRVGKVDFKNRTIMIDEVLARTRDGSHSSARVVKETKTGNVRLLPMNDQVYDLLFPLCDGKSRDSLVFVSPMGNMIDDRMLQQRTFKPILRELGIKDRVLYALRHSFSTRALQQGMTVYEVAQLMGHASIETTMRNYIHLVNRPKNLPGL